MKWIVLVFVTLIAWVAGDNLHTAVQRSRQKRTMATMHSMAALLAKGQQPAGNDAWGHPLIVRRTGPHYLIHASASDGKFEPPPPAGAPPMTTTKYSQDFVLRDGFFVKFPEGICYGDRPGKGPLGQCASCHPHRIQTR